MLARSDPLEPLPYTTHFFPIFFAAFYALGAACPSAALDPHRALIYLGADGSGAYPILKMTMSEVLLAVSLTVWKPGVMVRS